MKNRKYTRCPVGPSQCASAAMHTSVELGGSPEKTTTDFVLLLSTDGKRPHCSLDILVPSLGVELGTPALHTAPAHTVRTFILHHNDSGSTSCGQDSALSACGSQLTNESSHGKCLICIAVKSTCNQAPCFVSSWKRGAET